MIVTIRMNTHRQGTKTLGPRVTVHSPPKTSAPPQTKDVHIRSEPPHFVPPKETRHHFGLTPPKPQPQPQQAAPVVHERVDPQPEDTLGEIPIAMEIPKDFRPASPRLSEASSRAHLPRKGPSVVVEVEESRPQGDSGMHHANAEVTSERLLGLIARTNVKPAVAQVVQMRWRCAVCPVRTLIIMSLTWVICGEGVPGSLVATQ